MTPASVAGTMQTITYGPSNVNPNDRFQVYMPHGTSLSEQSIIAEDGISQLGVKTTLNIQGYLLASGEQDLDVQCEAMRCSLSTPRGVLTYKRGQTSGKGGAWSGETIKVGPGSMTGFLPQTWNDTLETWTPDIEYGPIPGSLTIDKFYGSCSAQYSWAITFITKNCLGCSLQLSSPLLAFYREYDYNIDADGGSVRKISGKLIIIPQSNTAGAISADSFRDQIVESFPCPDNFHRTAQHFNLSPNGKELTYDITDTESTGHNLPAPITQGQAFYTAKVSKLGARIDYTLSGWYQAPRGVTKQSIYNQISFTLAGLLNPPAVKRVSIIDTHEIKVSLFNPNRIDFNITWFTNYKRSQANPAQHINAEVGLAPVLADIKDTPAQWISPYGGTGGSTGDSSNGTPNGQLSLQTSGLVSPLPPGTHGVSGTGKLGASYDACNDSPIKDGDNAITVQKQGTLATSGEYLVINNETGNNSNYGVPANAAGTNSSNTQSPQSIPAPPQIYGSQTYTYGYLTQQAVNTANTVLGLAAADGSSTNQQIDDGYNSFYNNAEGGVAAIADYSQSVSYHCDNGIKVFAPKNTGLHAFAQQTHVPVMRVIQAGFYVVYAQNASQLPPPTPPIYKGGTIESFEVEPGVGEPVGDSTYYRFSCHWKYVIAVSTSTAADFIKENNIKIGYTIYDQTLVNTPLGGNQQPGWALPLIVDSSGQSTSGSAVGTAASGGSGSTVTTPGVAAATGSAVDQQAIGTLVPAFLPNEADVTPAYVPPQNWDFGPPI